MNWMGGTRRRKSSNNGNLSFNRARTRPSGGPRAKVAATRNETRRRAAGSHDLISINHRASKEWKFSALPPPPESNDEPSEPVGLLPTNKQFEQARPSLLDLPSTGPAQYRTATATQVFKQPQLNNDIMREFPANNSFKEQDEDDELSQTLRGSNQERRSSEIHLSIGRRAEPESKRATKRGEHRV